jgi:hypothetical protein
MKVSTKNRLPGIQGWSWIVTIVRMGTRAWCTYCPMGFTTGNIRVLMDKRIEKKQRENQEDNHAA